MVYLIALLCVLGIAAGQILFKLSAISLSRTGTFFSLHTALLLMAAFMLYGVTTIAWVWVLQKIELGKIYPLMALAFAIVPLASFIFLGEKFGGHYVLGVILIFVGVLFAVKP